jgi:hypothetical protein
MRKKGSFLSMENLIEAVEEDDKGKSNDTNDVDMINKDLETITVHPIFILSQAYSRVTAVGSSTALVAIRN